LRFSAAAREKISKHSRSIAKDNPLDKAEFSAFEINPEEMQMMEQIPSAPTAPRS
jgi:hypothetical protein